MRDVTKVTPFDRALREIAPAPDQQQRCRELLALFIEASKEPDTPRVSPIITRERLTAAGKALRVALKATERLPMVYRRLCSPPLTTQSVATSLRDLVDPRSATLLAERAELTAALFLDGLKHAAVTAEQWAKQISVSRKGGRPDFRKREAAENAVHLLRRFGQKKPTLTAVRRLALILYEAGAGNPAGGLTSQCREVLERAAGKPPRKRRRRNRRG
jgi:hypothetical protein